MTIPNQTRGWSDSHICWLAALVVTIFIVTGSLVPFDLTWPGGLTLAAWPMQLRFTAWQLVSGTDVIVNVAVGAPLGFFLAGAVRSDGRCSGTVAMLAATGMAAVLATTVELFQVLSAFRQSSWNDVLAQTAGAAVGAVGWMSIGRQVVLWLHHLAGEREPSGFAARILEIYLPIYLLVQFTTVDAIRASELPTDHSRAQVILLPIRLGFESTLLLGWECVGSALLSLPIGMLAVLGWVRQGERRPLRYAIPLGCMIVLIGIAAPATSWSRPFATELSAALLGVMIGVGAATATSWRSMPLQSLSGARRLRPWLLLSTAVWIFVIVAQAWHSSSYQLSSVLPRDGGPWLSGAPFDSYDLYSASPIQALHESILEFLMAFPLGFLLRLSWPLGVGRLRRTQGIILAAVVVLVLAGVELGQSAPPMRSADAMDMLVAMSGGIVGLLSGVPFLRRQRTA